MGEINRYILHLRILDILRIAVDSKRADGAVHTLRIGIDDGDLTSLDIHGGFEERIAVGGLHHQLQLVA